MILGFIKATIDFALNRDELKKQVASYLAEVYREQILLKKK